MSEHHWHGTLDPSELKDAIVADGHALADAAKAGDWSRTLELAARHPLGVNSWRPGGDAWWTPLHQAAFHGAPDDIVDRLLELGAWRSLRTTDGKRAVDLARERGHDRLIARLEAPRLRVDPSAEECARIDAHLAALVEGRIRPHLGVRLRHPATEVLCDLDDRTLWYPVPGMYGGFSIRLREHHLYVESWSRVAGGSGQAHVVTVEGTTLVDEGFV